MSIALKRAYEQAQRSDGYRVLVDKMWPRGRSKDELELDAWLKEIAPSDELRQSLHDGGEWNDFRQRYLQELKSHRDTLRDLADKAQQGKLTLVYAASDAEHNNAVVVRQYLKMLRPEVD